MVSTRRSGSLSGNNGKRSSSSEDKSPSPKRQKEDSGGASDRPMPAADNSKELCSPPAPTDPAECADGDAAVTGDDCVSTAKGEVTPAVAVAAPIPEGTSPLVVDKHRSSFPSWNSFQKQSPSFESSTPWCRLLSQLGQNPNVPISCPSFTIGASRQCNFPLKDQTISGILCKIKHNQREGAAVATLETTGSKGLVQVNGTAIKKNSSCTLNSGDEIVFGVMGNHAYIFQQIVSDPTVKGSEMKSMGKLFQLERRSGDNSAMTGASILASISSLKQDISRWKPPGTASIKIYQAPEVPAHSAINDGMDIDDGLEGNSAPNLASEKAAEDGAMGKSLPVESSQDVGTEAGNVFEESSEWTRDSQPASTSGMSLRCAVFKQEVHAGILDGREIEVSFDNFPYYLSENTKNVLIAASFIHLKHREHAKYASDLPTVNPRILLSGPAGSEIYQEMLAKALANHFGAKLLVFDSHSFLGGLSSKEAELLKEGINVDKSCNCPKQSPLPADLVKAINLPVGDGDAPSSSNAPSSFVPDSQPKVENDNVASSSGASKSNSFKLGDRVRFVGSASGSVYASSPSRGPASGKCGKVVLLFEDNPMSKIGVRFDKSVSEGVDLGGSCEGGHGFFCNATDLRLESSCSEDLDKLLIDTLFEAVSSESRNSPFILFMKDAEKSIAGNSDAFPTFKSRIEKLPNNIVVIGSHTHTDNRKEKSHPGGLLFTKFGSNQTALLDLAFPDSFGRLHDRGKEVPKVTKLLTKLFPNKVTIHMPQDEVLLASWKHQLDRDSETLKIKGNLNNLRTVLGRCGMECEGLDTICIKDQTLAAESAEKVIGWALSHHLMQNPESNADSRLVLSSESIQYGIGILQAIQNESKSLKKSLKDVVTENEFEKRLLADVIPPSDIGVTFDDIGALENVKDTLKELVMLPLQRPELFCKGQLTKVLLFSMSTQFAPLEVWL